MVRKLSSRPDRKKRTESTWAPFLFLGEPGCCLNLPTEGKRRFMECEDSRMLQ